MARNENESGNQNGPCQTKRTRLSDGQNLWHLLQAMAMRLHLRPRIDAVTAGTRNEVNMEVEHGLVGGPTAGVHEVDAIVATHAHIVPAELPHRIHHRSAQLPIGIGHALRMPFRNHQRMAVHVRRDVKKAITSSFS